VQGPHRTGPVTGGSVWVSWPTVPADTTDTTDTEPAGTGARSRGWAGAVRIIIAKAIATTSAPAVPVTRADIACSRSTAVI
jgi:hypothetical protein